VLTRLFRARNQLRALCGEDTGMDPPISMDAEE